MPISAATWAIGRLWQRWTRRCRPSTDSGALRWDTRAGPFRGLMSWSHFSSSPPGPALLMSPPRQCQQPPTPQHLPLSEYFSSVLGHVPSLSKPTFFHQPPPALLTAEALSDLRTRWQRPCLTLPVQCPLPSSLLKRSQGLHRSNRRLFAALHGAQTREPWLFGDSRTLRFLDLGFFFPGPGLLIGCGRSAYALGRCAELAHEQLVRTDQSKARPGVDDPGPGRGIGDRHVRCQGRTGADNQQCPGQQSALAAAASVPE